MVNKEIHKNKHSHEMTRFQNRIAVWSSLHESVMFYGSSHGSVFESPVHRVQNGYKSESPVTEFGSSERVRNAITRHQTQREEGESTYAHKTLTHIILILACHTCIHPRVHPHTYVYTHPNTYTSMHIHIHYTYIYPDKHTLKHSLTHTHASLNTYIQTCIHAYTTHTNSRTHQQTLYHTNKTCTLIHPPTCKYLHNTPR